jgi:hypothetical protein
MAGQRGNSGTTLTEETVTAFKASLRGALLRPGDHGYEETRKIWNAMIDKKPALIARCAGVVDVINAVHSSPVPMICSLRCAAVGTTWLATRCVTTA